MEKDLDLLFETCVSSTVEENAETTIIDGKDSALQYSQTYNVRLPKPEEKIALNTSEILKMKEICADAKNESFSFAEVFLGASSLLLGAFLSAIISRVHYEFTLLSIFLYTICPVGGVGFGVAYFYSRNKAVSDIKQFASRIESCINVYDETDIEERK